ncbi:MAG: SbcC/MukB-like Walker B domain-containing protein [Cyanobacteria bacterium P01_F01_bin.150]
MTKADVLDTLDNERTAKNSSKNGSENGNGKSTGGQGEVSQDTGSQGTASQNTVSQNSNGHYGENALAGFRLQRLEILNWGTFDQTPWALDLNGGIGLLTGANGSGKSTLVDGMLTLLVPNRGRNYNQASTGTGKKERNEKSYVQGAYGRTRSEESYGSKPKLLREKATLSVLLAYFQDHVSAQNVTLAQVLWMQDGSVRKFFVLADEQLTIRQDFSQFSRVADLKKQLKVNGAFLFDDFTRYSQQFRKRLGLQSEKALDLFNQTVSIKEIGGLNDFVRNHMLEKVDMRTKIRELQESYENLTVSHTAILNARQQLEALKPLTDEAKKYKRLKDDAAKTQALQGILPAFFACKKLTLLVQDLQAINQELTQYQDQRTERDRHLSDLRQREKDLEFAIKQDSIGQRLQELAREIAQAKEAVDRSQKQATAYNQLAAKLEFGEYTDRDTFYTNRTEGEDLKAEIETGLNILEGQRDELKVEQAELVKQCTELEEELKSLRSRKSQIPKSNLDIRDRLVKDLKLDETELPFVGELLQVRPEAQEWEGAIERLLRGFGLCVLVSDDDYAAVNAYVHRTHLKGRLVYYRITDDGPGGKATQRDVPPDHVPYKLEIKQDNLTFYQWLRGQLVRQFNYVCCDSIEQFQREARAITTSGLIKHGGERHEKDDRSKIGDRSRYILGWSNVNKIKALESELRKIKKQLKQIEQRIQFIEEERGKRQQQRSWLQDFMNYEDFSDIDWRSLDFKRIDLENQRQELEASSDRLKQLEQQLQDARTEIAEAEQQRETLIRQIQTLEDRQASAQEEQSKCEAIADGSAASDLEAFEKAMATKLKKYEMTLATIAKEERNLHDFLRDKVRQHERKQEKSESSLQIQMERFKNSFPEMASELGTTLDYVEEYVNRKNQIQKDDLPRHEKRFKQLMNEKVIIAISMFKSALEKQEEEIQQAIEELNESLQKIDYTDSTYINLCCDTTRNREIRDFKDDLKLCLGDVAKQDFEDNEERFNNIQTRLIERFKAEDRWTALVTDVRKWLDFSVSERYRADHTEKEHHTDSSGKSGGQKVKLAYTILASAIAYQFGLNQESIKHKSFRFVVIDEAFSKSDDSNARYAMELFKNLNLQLLVVTPKDKINVIEPYIASLHFVSNTPEGDCSKIASITIEDYRYKRQEALNGDRSE